MDGGSGNRCIRNSRYSIAAPLLISSLPPPQQ
jgi:hypothetical protein